MLKKRKNGISTQLPERIDKLLELVPGKMDEWRNIGYQLLTALCGTAIQAKEDKSNTGIFIVHEFHSWLTSPRKLKKNAEMYDRFLTLIGANGDFTLKGPVTVADMPVWIGKVVTEIDKY